jgi:hypothetical protein
VIVIVFPVADVVAPPAPKIFKTLRAGVALPVSALKVVGTVGPICVAPSGPP